MSATRLRRIGNRLGRPRLLVLGDLMLDCYTWGNVGRTSPEAPVLILDADPGQPRPGGAASAAYLAQGLDARVTLSGVVGDDASGQTLRDLLDESGIDQELVVSDSSRPTTVKHRYIGRADTRHPHQILRVDREVRRPLNRDLEEHVCSQLCERIGQFDAVLVSDYGKGFCTPRLLGQVIAASAASGVPILIDPARISDYSRYRDATLLTPNRAETEAATRLAVETPEDARNAGKLLCQRYALRAVLVTLDCQGMVLVRADGSGEHIPTTPREVHDITGAGDVVLATVGLCHGSGIELFESAQLANEAAGLEVERLGIARVERVELQARLIQASSNAEGRVVTLDEMAILRRSYRCSGKTVVFTNGCFDLLHVGHARYLEEAKRLGDVLVVAVNSDRSVRRLKSPDRPVISQADRAALLTALRSVDHVLIFDSPTPHELLHRLCPDVLVKGGTYTPEQVVGREVVESQGGRVRVTGKTSRVSTTEIVSSIASKAKPCTGGGANGCRCIH